MNRYWNLDQPVQDLYAFTVKVLKPANDRSKEDESLTGKQCEVDVLYKRHIWKIANVDDVRSTAW